MNSLRIATWNLDNPSLNSPRANACRAKIAEIHADIWVLTEPGKEFNAGEDYHLAAESEPDCDPASDRRWTAIWVRNSITSEQILTNDPKRTACARLVTTDGFILYVYGTVLPWRGSKWKDFGGAGGRAFTESLAVQKADWSVLRRDHPEAGLCVAGDFNQDLLESRHYYSSKVERKALREALDEANLKCLTGGKEDPVEKLNTDLANIDHICLGGPVQQFSEPVEVTAWSQRQLGFTMSDHYGVSVKVCYP